MFLRSLALVGGLGAAAVCATPSASVTPEPGVPATVHCQVPCGIYGDSMRIDMWMEDAATIQKGMQTLVAMDAEASPSKNQMVRWVMTKDDHAQAIQDQVAAYWLAQRIKTPAEGSDAEATAAYHRQLELMHRLTVAAMKCKQTTDTAHVTSLGTLALEFSGTYFTGEDLEHLKEHHEGEHR